MNVCDDVDWNPVEVGQTHSQLAAVIAGFLFAGVVFLLGRRRPPQNDSYPYVLMLPSFFVLLLDSFFFSVISGEQSCNRAWTETMIAAGLLGTGSLGVFGGLCWLIYNSRRGEREPLRIMLVTCHIIAVVVLTHLQVTTSYYLDDIFRPGDPPFWLSATTWVVTGAIACLLVCASLARRLPRRKSPLVHAAAYCSLFYGVICSVAFALLGGRPKSSWEPTPGWIAMTAVLLALTTAGIAVASQVAALPTRKEAQTATPPSAPGAPITDRRDGVATGTGAPPDG
ncbi:hypothetical protein [Actinoplanes sp. NPDC048796]|uniref:hypothetical protein n=1 Tax=Actinoplanes sp. NPDC048796 TaxID=3155640 RepID=UPI0033EB80D1